MCVRLMLQYTGNDVVDAGESVVHGYLSEEYGFDGVIHLTEYGCSMCQYLTLNGFLCMTKYWFFGTTDIFLPNRETYHVEPAHRFSPTGKGSCLWFIDVWKLVVCCYVK